mmetsp:Transcript_43560/g.170527  ORF Transcript_43560/g.170527 Transcript_43560/m.170527 type:complete len:92 (-) Transcript_43560:1132-1407(-)|eukprot:CAMPEP_0113971898 /NCGR_PEP_ID=MMETSP0011_2-20120614/12747_1 /TAXON_ID=101924 /ORGANISM="Rhodosorus marinus" /LENGTH=91 /DNA_ID=CAMNT_0000987955 /DNA_START=385 /DNA_END=660 /DNA_ORIENTATION=- /assembly_acc=CAM_ASM_000156
MEDHKDRLVRRPNERSTSGLFLFRGGTTYRSPRFCRKLEDDDVAKGSLKNREIAYFDVEEEPNDLETKLLARYMDSVSHADSSMTHRTSVF